MVYFGLRSWLLLFVKASLTVGLAAATLVSYSSLGRILHEEGFAIDEGKGSGQESI
uniref:Uncharacterized protein n=1 Tax=Parascaris equorum TaxID=6256 RepID=A0A914R9A9_PAREQ